MDKIAKHYVDEAYRIRREYLENLKHINDKADIVNEYKNQISKIRDELTGIINSGENNFKEEFANTKMEDIDSNITAIQNELRPYTEKIDELGKQSKILYDSIKDKYNLLSEEDIQNEIYERVIKRFE